MNVEYPSRERYVVDVSNPHFLIADHGSSIFLGAEKNTSCFNGISFLRLDSYALTKVVHDVSLNKRVERITVSPDKVIRSYRAVTEELFMHDRLACIRVLGDAEVSLSLDVRDSYDLAEFGREHTVHVVDGAVSTATVTRGDDAFVILSNGPLKVSESWVERPTPYDHRRGGKSSWWVLDGIRVLCAAETRIVIAPAHRKHQALAALQAHNVWQRGLSEWRDVLSDVAYASLRGLVTTTPSGEAAIIAGLPWFFQIYTRDEAIAVGALLSRKEYLLAARILLREISIILPDGRIPNRFPSSDTGSADGVGWAFLRLAQLFDADQSVLSRDQWMFVREQLVQSLSRLHRDGLFVVNGAQETWMDTTGGSGDTRAGARIEIQALTLRMLRFCAGLSEHLGMSGDEYLVEEQSLLHAVRKTFFVSGENLLVDGVWGDQVDKTVRPNAMLALYAYPWLLSLEESRLVATEFIARLKTHWGGLSTISPDNSLFCEHHSGGDDRSYHRGDVWYFVNNMIAVALLRIDPSFRGFARKVHDASRRDLLELGACGHASEISSFGVQEAFGCWSQAWSASSFVELRDLLYGR